MRRAEVDRSVDEVLDELKAVLGEVADFAREMRGDHDELPRP